MSTVSLPYGDSCIHRLDPRGKIISAVLLSATIALLHQVAILLMAFCLGCILICMSRISLAVFAKRLFLFNIFVLFFWLLMFTHPGDAIITIGPLGVTDEGMKAATIMTLKANAIFLVVTALLATISLTTIGQAMHQLGIPKKFVHILLFTYRYIHVLEKEFQRLRNAVAVRGFVPASNTHTYRTYAYLVGILLLRSVERAERIHDAMICRGFHGRFYSLREFRLAPLDYIVFPALFFFAAGLWSVEWLVMN